MKHLNNMLPKKFATVFIFVFMACLLMGFGPRLVILTKPVMTDTAAGLVASDALLQIKLTGKLKELMNDRESADPQSFPFSVP